MTDLYTKRLLSYWNPNLRGFHDQDYTHMASGTSSLCGDEVEFRVTLKDGLLGNRGRVRTGCCLSECCTRCSPNWPWQGLPLVWLDTFTNQDWVNHVNVPVGESR